MKKAFTLALFATGLAIAAEAQTPVKKTKSAVFEFSDTWCTPCGAYGIDVADSLLVQMEQLDKGYLIGVKTTSTPASLNAVGGQVMFDNFECDGVPSFIINNSSIDEGVTHNNAGDVARMLGKISVFDSIEAAGGIAAEISITGNIVTVKAKSKFWNATTGNYYMSVILAEDHISATQNAYPSNPAIHPNVMRGAMATSGTALATDPWGESVGTTTITANQEFTKTFTAAIDPTWNSSNLKAFAVIFRKKTDNSYETVNIDKAKAAVTTVGELALLQEVSIYPNPAADIIHIAIDAAEYLSLDARITDVQGRIVYEQKGIIVNKGGSDLQIKTGNLTGGIYTVSLSNGKMGVVRRSVVVR